MYVYTPHIQASVASDGVHVPTQVSQALIYYILVQCTVINVLSKHLAQQVD